MRRPRVLRMCRPVALIVVVVSLAGGLTVLPSAVRAQDGCAAERDVWARLASPVAAPTALAVDPLDPQTALVADARRVAATADAGCSWTVVVDLGDAPAAGEVAVETDRVTAVDVRGGTAVVAITIGAGVGGLPTGAEAGVETTTVLRSSSPTDPDGYVEVLGPTTAPDGAGAAVALTGRPMAVAVAGQGIGVVVEQQGGRTEVLVRPASGGPWQSQAAFEGIESSSTFGLPSAAVDGLSWGADGSDPLYAWGLLGLRAITAAGAMDVGPPVGPIGGLGVEPGRLTVTEQRSVVHTSTDGGASWTEQPGPDPAAAPADIAADAGARAAVLPGVRDGRVLVQFAQGPWTDITDPARPRQTAVAMVGGPQQPTVWAAGSDGVQRIALAGDVTDLDVPEDDPLRDLLLGIEEVTPIPPAPATVGVAPTAVTLDVGARRTVTVEVDLPPRPGPVDVGFIVDGTGSMGPFIRPLRDRFAEIVRVFAERSVDAHYGVAVYRVHPTALEPGGDIYTRRADIGPPGPELAAGLRGLDIPGAASNERQDAPGGNLPTSAIEALHQAATGAGYDVPPATPIPPGEGFTFRPGTARLLLNATDVIFERGRPGATLESAIDAMVDRGVQQAGVFVANTNANAGGFADLQAVARGTGALAAAPIDCDGDGRDDIAAGDPVVCGRPDASAPLGQEIPQGRLPEAIVDLALAAPELRPVRVEASASGGVQAEPAAPTDADVRRPSRPTVDVTVACPPTQTTGTVQLTAVLGQGADASRTQPEEVLGTAAVAVTCLATAVEAPPAPVDPAPVPPADPPAPELPAQPTSSTAVIQQPSLAAPPGGAPPAPITVPAPAPAPAAATGTAAAPSSAGASATGSTGATASAGATGTSPSVAVAAPPATATGSSTSGAGQAASSTGAAPVDRQRSPEARVRTATVDGRRLPATALAPASARQRGGTPHLPVVAGALALGVLALIRRDSTRVPGVPAVRSAKNRNDNHS